MPINSACTGCGQVLTVAEVHAGKRARCPSCGQIYTVPLQSTTSQAGNSIQPSHTSATPSQPTPASGNLWSDPSVPQPTADQPGPDQAFAPLASTETSQNPATKYWMRAVDGTVYGPVDRINLDRWFREGRVGLGYQIREEEQGAWTDAATFQPVQPGTTNGPAVGGPYEFGQPPVNPYAAPTAAYGGSPNQYIKSDKGVLVLIMGIMSWFFGCFIFGIAAVVIGKDALSDMDAGIANPKDRTLVTIGYWLGLIHLILSLLGVGGAVLLIALSAIGAIR